LQYRADLEDELHLHGRTFLDIDKFAAKHGISTRRAQRIAVIAAARRSNVSLLLLESGEEWVADHGPRPNEVIESNEKSKLIMDQLDTLEERERQYLHGAGSPGRRRCAGQDEEEDRERRRRGHRAISRGVRC